jgi:hypothetical protein
MHKKIITVDGVPAVIDSNVSMFLGSSKKEFAEYYIRNIMGPDNEYYAAFAQMVSILLQDVNSVEVIRAILSIEELLTKEEGSDPILNEHLNTLREILGTADYQRIRDIVALELGCLVSGPIRTKRFAQQYNISVEGLDKIAKRAQTNKKATFVHIRYKLK